MIYVEKRLGGNLPYDSDETTLSKISDRLVGLFEPLDDADQGALTVVSANAGWKSALEFWAEARRSGFGFANPELFPWTLANAPCGWLSRRFQITGPNATFTGQIDALLAALEHSHDQLRRQSIETAWLIVLDFAQRPSQRTRFRALRLSRDSGCASVDPIQPTDRTSIRSVRTIAALDGVFRALDGGQVATLSDGNSAWLFRNH